MGADWHLRALRATPGVPPSPEPGGQLGARAGGGARQPAVRLRSARLPRSGRCGRWTRWATRTSSPRRGQPVESHHCTRLRTAGPSCSTIRDVRRLQGNPGRYCYSHEPSSQSHGRSLWQLERVPANDSVTLGGFKLADWTYALRRRGTGCYRARSSELFSTIKQQGGWLEHVEHYFDSANHHRGQRYSIILARLAVFALFHV
jgi:hypothetical protein